AVPEAGLFAILGRALLSNERDAQANKQALAMYERALALDPDWIPALLGYGRSIVDDVRNGWMSRDVQAAGLLEAEGAIEHAIKLKPDLWGAHHLNCTCSAYPRTAITAAWAGRPSLLRSAAAFPAPQFRRQNGLNAPCAIARRWAGRVIAARLK